MVTLRILPRFHATPEVRSLPSTSITRFRGYYEPLRLPGRPSLSLAGVRLRVRRPHRQDLPCCLDLPVQTCRRLYPGGIVGGIELLPRNLRQRPSPSRCWVGSHIRRFEASSAFTLHYSLPARGTANRPFPSKASALSLPKHTAPIATGWSNICQGGVAPPEDRHLCTAHNGTGLIGVNFKHSDGRSLLSMNSPRPDRLPFGAKSVMGHEKLKASKTRRRLVKHRGEQCKRGRSCLYPLHVP
jgi:hypothetical protein